MDFRAGAEAEAFRAEVREVLRTHCTDEVRRCVAESGTEHSWELHRALARAGMIGAAWPVDEGGRGRSPHEMDALYEEAARAGAPMAGFSTTMLVAETIRRAGTTEQRERVLPAVVAGELVISLGYSEPNIGSDVASVQTRAERRPDGTWLLNGQKAFTTTAEEAGYVFALARTTPTVAKHRGLTLFLVPTDSAGFSISPLWTLGGERSNMTFFSDVVLDDRARVGEVDDGWRVMLVALDFERGGEFAAELLRLVDLITAWAAECPSEVTEGALRRIGRVAAETEVARLLGSRATCLRAEGRPANLEGTMAKLYATEALQRNASTLLDVRGPSGAPRSEVGGPAHDEIEAMYRHSFATTIYGGTSEILRGVIAERHLGLPRAPRPRETVS